MHIPDTLDIIQYGNSTLNCIRYVNFLGRKQETVNIIPELVLQYPDLFQDQHITRACYNTAFAMEHVAAQQYPMGIRVKSESVANLPTNNWQILGSDGHDCHLIHPVWGIWTLTNNEVLYLYATKAFSKEMFQFYVKDGLLKLGIVSEIQVMLESQENKSVVSIADINAEDIGRVIRYGKHQYLVVGVEEHLNTYELPGFRLSKTAKGTPLWDNGYQLHQHIVERTDKFYPTLAEFGSNLASRGDLAAKAQRLKEIFQYQLFDLLTEAFQIRKGIVFRWEGVREEQVPVNLWGENRPVMIMPPPLAELLNDANGNHLQTPLCIRILKKAKATYELTIQSTYPVYNNLNISLEEIVELLIDKLQVHNLSFVDRFTVIHLQAD